MSLERRCGALTGSIFVLGIARLLGLPFSKTEFVQAGLEAGCLVWIVARCRLSASRASAAAEFGADRRDMAAQSENPYRGTLSTSPRNEGKQDVQKD